MQRVMKKLSKNTLALLLAAALILGVFPISSLAVEGVDPASPSSITESPAPTPTKTPKPVETPVAPNPTPASASSLSELFGEELYEYLRGLDIVTRVEVIKLLSVEQRESLVSFLTKRELVDWFPAESPAYEEESGLPAVDMFDAGALVSAPAAMQNKSARATLNTDSSATSENGLFLTKRIDPNIDGTYKIRMEAYTTGQVSTVTKPVDIVLVLDQSGSMDYSMSSYDAVTGSSYRYSSHTYYGFSNYNGEYYIKNTNGSYTRVYWSDDDNKDFDYYRADGTNQLVYPLLSTNYGARQYGYPVVQFYTRTSQTRLSALRNAVTAFVNNVKNDAVTHSVEHRVAIVGFAEGESNYDNTEILSVTSGNPVKYGAGGYNAAVGAALLPVNNSGSINPALTTAISRLDGDGETRSDLGMQMASDIFGHTSYNGTATLPSGQTINRVKVVILFTDGVPTDGGTQFDSSVANAAIAKSRLLKTDNTTVYSIGIFDGANPNSISDNPNKYMNYVSSNYLTAASLSGNYSRNPSGNYYLSAADANGLITVFENISDQVSAPTTPLTGAAIMKDVVTSYFTIPAGTSVTFKAAAYNGSMFEEETSFMGPTASIIGNEITVTNFDFDENYCTNTPRNGFYGRKLIVEFDVSRAPGFIGGNNVPTNVSEISGLYENASSINPLETFGDSPVINVPIWFNTASLQNRSIYAGDDVVLTNLFGATYATTEDGSTYTLGDAVTNQYAKVAYSIREDSTIIGTYTVLEGSSLGSGEWTGTSALNDLLTDKTYTVTATVTPSELPSNSNGSAGSIEDRDIGSANINVFKPAITPRDLSVYLTQNPTAAQLNAAVIAQVVWKHGDDTASTATMGAVPPPGLTYTFSGLPTSPVYPTADIGIAVATVTRTDGNRDVLTSVSTIEKTVAAPTNTHLKLFVLKPAVTCADTTIFLGDTTDIDQRINLPLTWSKTAGAPDVTVPFLPNPNFAISHQFVSGSDPATNGGKDLFAAKVNSNFKVTAKYGDVDLIGLGLCEVRNSGTVVTANSHHFTVFVVTGALTITKGFGNNPADAPKSGESFLFTVTGPSGMKLHAVIQGGGEAKITGLPKGSYTVTEDTNWSWRYNTTDYSWTGGSEISLEQPNITCTVTNSNRTPFWLSGESAAANWFKPTA